jgi:hypothetical protein
MQELEQYVDWDLKARDEYPLKGWESRKSVFLQNRESSRKLIEEKQRAT